MKLFGKSGRLWYWAIMVHYKKFCRYGVKHQIINQTIFIPMSVLLPYWLYTLGLQHDLCLILTGLFFFFFGDRFSLLPLQIPVHGGSGFRSAVPNSTNWNSREKVLFQTQWLTLLQRHLHCHVKVCVHLWWMCYKYIQSYVDVNYVRYF